MRASDIIEFLEPPISIGWDLPPEQALAFMRARGLRESFSYADLIGEERTAAFTVAKMLDTDLLATVHESLIDAAARGVSYDAWAKSIIPTLQERGWWGRKEVIDPATGERRMATLGTPARLQTIFRTNMQTAYAVGEWQQIIAQAEDAPYLQYDAVDDHRTRPLHAAWDNIVLPVRHPWWRTHMPPNGWNCRCSVIQLSKNDLEDLGLEVTTKPPVGTYDWTNPRTGKVEKIPIGIDPGFDHNPGQRRLEELERLAVEKVKALPPEPRKAAAEGLRETQRAIALQFDPTTAAGAWHVKSWSGAQDWLRPILVREQAVNVTNRSGGAYAMAGREINMPASYTTASLDNLSMWRHEFGHILNWRIGIKTPGSVSGHVSSGEAFTAAMRADARALAKAAYADSAAAAKREQLRQDYLALQGRMIDMTPDARLLYLRDRAAALGIAYDDLRAELKANSTALFDTLAGDVRMARIMEAIELRDIQRFIAEAAGMDTTGQLAGASAEDRRAYFLAVRDTWKRGCLGHFADLAGAATRNRIAGVNAGFPGHTEAYYRKRPGYGQQTEAFANLTAFAGAPHPIWWRLVKVFFPKMADEFERIIRNA